jgi:hypothetical protein
MYPLKLYQTLQDRDNPQEIEDYGPYICNWENTWLGDGYYFWDGHIELAHWWGRVHRHNKYIICEADAVYDTKCWDLYSRPDLRIEFQNIVAELEKQNIYKSHNTTIATYVEYLKDLGFFENKGYNSIRILGSNSVNIKNITTGITAWQLFFEKKLRIKSPGNFQFVQPVQFCLFKKSSLGLRNYKVVYPDHHREDYSN